VIGRVAGFRGILRTDDDARAVYSEAAGIARIMPLAVAVPADAEDVRALVQWAQATRTPLVPRGSGTSMAGGAVGPGVIVDMSRLRALGEVDIEARRVWAEPGVIRDDLDAAARTRGLFFPVDPSSGAYCTMGGMASTNAAGPHTLLYGPTRHWISALDCVFDDGTRAVVRRGEPPPSHVPAIARLLEGASAMQSAAPALAAAHAGVRKDSSGYDVRDYVASGELVDLLVGSEGTLALFVGIEVALAPRPAATASVLAAFASLDAAVVGAGAARERGASACELLDRTFLDFVRGTGGQADEIPADTEAVLLAEVEGDDDAKAAASAGSLADRFTTAGATKVVVALEPVTDAALWDLRHAASPILARLDASLKSMQFIEDGAVPPSRLADYVRGVRASLVTHGVRAAIFGHAGDAHVHVNPLIDVRDSSWRARVDGLLSDVTAMTAQLGGTLTGEHGDGQLRTPLLTSFWPKAARDMFALVKHAFDPRGILNPGVKVPLDGAQALGDIKYDPNLRPLPPRAQRVLAELERRRTYATFRLAMLDEVPAV
jgi:FAD/FMN-containing dehydrogenase